MYSKLPTQLNGIEYLLLAMQSQPGESQRHYLRRLHVYQWGRPDYHKGGTNCGYFNSLSYRNVTWYDAAPKDVKYFCFAPVDGQCSNSFKRWSGGTRTKCAEMHLTRHGWARANEARQKIGLEPVPYVQHIA